jgi:hypothetical protein
VNPSHHPGIAYPDARLSCAIGGSGHGSPDPRNAHIGEAERLDQPGESGIIGIDSHAVIGEISRHEPCPTKALRLTDDKSGMDDAIASKGHVEHRCVPRRSPDDDLGPLDSSLLVPDVEDNALDRAACGAIVGAETQPGTQNCAAHVCRVQPMAVRIQERGRGVVDPVGQRDVTRLRIPQGTDQLGRSVDRDSVGRDFIRRGGSGLNPAYSGARRPRTLFPVSGKS